MKKKKRTKQSFHLQNKWVSEWLWKVRVFWRICRNLLLRSGEGRLHVGPPGDAQGAGSAVGAFKSEYIFNVCVAVQVVSVCMFYRIYRGAAITASLDKHKHAHTKCCLSSAKLQLYLHFFQGDLKKLKLCCNLCLLLSLYVQFLCERVCPCILRLKSA